MKIDLGSLFTRPVSATHSSAFLLLVKKLYLKGEIDLDQLLEFRRAGFRLYQARAERPELGRQREEDEDEKGVRCRVNIISLCFQ